MGSAPSSFASDLHAFVLESALLIFHVFIQPLLFHPSFRGISDPTFGRDRLPYSYTEKRLIYENPKVKATTERVILSREALRKGKSWDRPGTAWVTYHVWEMLEATDREHLNADVILIHGLNDYSGKLAPHGSRFMEAGFRVIAVDLPAFGRSTGLHAYLPSMRLLVEALRAVICQIQENDKASGNVCTRKVFLEGHSMGAFTALYYAALYSPDPAHRISDQGQRQISGVVVVAPMIAISPESRPGYAVELLAKALALFAGRLPLAAAVRGNVSDDPRVEKEHEQDPQTYKGKLRIATGLSVLAGLIDLELHASKITVPVAIHHGDRDRATSYRGSVKFFETIGSQEKSLRLWEGYEHVMMKFVQSGGGMTDEDKAKTAAVLEDITAWLVRQAKAQ
ncbi:alpha/beta-hydrolase [Tilletiaria anomala UBC 951]|uniref:Alpha/beta-hydrolase n=1 Tax=Tilletiaria anomala (strain ATCC 24038 / CBS 436.72 / UBC 951) TaxID=1037660 RepID=A0A066W789_TILAU|nr:alpha/beta-hydrolase [Tilletiaria anomala UBC 951]KDN49616.1 alpha/beta-hydrolase [Tilletiaria anomala UBC 951]